MPSNTTALLSCLLQLIHQLIDFIPNQHANETTVLPDLIHQIQQTVGYIMSQHMTKYHIHQVLSHLPVNPLVQIRCPSLTLIIVSTYSSCYARGTLTWNYIHSILYGQLHERVQRFYVRLTNFPPLPLVPAPTYICQLTPGCTLPLEATFSSIREHLRIHGYFQRARCPWAGCSQEMW